MRQKESYETMNEVFFENGETKWTVKTGFKVITFI